MRIFKNIMMFALFLASAFIAVFVGKAYEFSDFAWFMIAGGYLLAFIAGGLSVQIYGNVDGQN